MLTWTQLYGRGYSEAPQGKYENSLYVWQLHGVLDKLGWHDGIYLAGLSMVRFAFSCVDQW